MGHNRDVETVAEPPSARRVAIDKYPVFELG
jgi:hypothetical protein